MKWKWTRLWRSSQRSTSGVEWVEELSSTTWSGRPRIGLDELVEERDELLVAVLGVAGTGDLAGRDLQRGVEAGRAVALVVMRHPLRLARLHRQRRLGAIERLDLGLLIHAQHQCAFGRVEVEPDDVDDLLRQLRITGELERAHLVRLELVIAPDPVHGRRRQPRRRPPAGGRSNACSHPAAARASSRAPAEPRHRRSDADAPNAAVREPVKTPLRKTPPPQPDRRQRHPGLRRDLRVRRTLGRTQHDPRPQRLLLRRRRRPHHRPQPPLILLRKLDLSRARATTTTVPQLTLQIQETNGTLH